jgi:hypothetical protein
VAVVAIVLIVVYAGGNGAAEAGEAATSAAFSERFGTAGHARPLRPRHGLAGSGPGTSDTSRRGGPWSARASMPGPYGRCGTGAGAKASFTLRRTLAALPSSTG